MWGVIPANDEVIVLIEPIVGIALESVAVILLVDTDRAAIGEGYSDLEGVVVDSGDGDFSYVLGKNGPDAGDPSLQQGAQGVSPGRAAMR